ncbi:histidine kinase [Mesobacillus campisalis]|uniref:histidine kinase n=1 Tax=Mesobacillus campisalis TaxID=1408103 RepID=A0A0M2SYG6_9BACI|nr:ATP-binding protein [Mesobacillus campisalis]KKK38751.1 histidine kinase [Mesobacillus campisalis]
MLVEYFINLSIFALLVSIPLVVRSFVDHRPLPLFPVWIGLYAGMVAWILVLLTIQYGGYSYDLRYAPVLLVFSYLGPVGGLITGTVALAARLMVASNWVPAVTAWVVIMLSFTAIWFLAKKMTPVKRTAVTFAAYTVIYVIITRVYQIVPDNVFFHVQYVLFVLLGVVLGTLLIESYMKLYRFNSKLSEMYKMVEESEAKYRLIAENTSDLILVVDKHQNISYYSPSHQSLLGYPSAQLEKMELLEIIHPDDAGAFRRKMEKMFAAETFQSAEFRLHHKDGRWIEFESRCMPVKGENGEVEHIVFISRDISERKKAEEALLKSEKLSIVGELAAGVAHEIRNPLTTIKGFVQLQRWENGSNSYNELLLSELERIETITSELLSLGKPQAVQMTTTDIQELIEKTIGLLSPQAHLHNIQFHFDSDRSPIFITCEKNQIMQVFVNIFKNAIEAMPDGGRIDVAARKSAEGEALISVQDQGCGIPENLLHRIGEPFYTLKEKGTGLGLMICHKIIKQHNGSIAYKSKLQQGTRIDITLPLAAEGE